MVPDRFILLPDTGAASRGDAVEAGVEVVKIGERPRFVRISDLSGEHRTWVMKSGLVSTGQPDIMALRPWIKITGELRKILGAQLQAA